MAWLQQLTSDPGRLDNGARLSSGSLRNGFASALACSSQSRTRQHVLGLGLPSAYNIKGGSIMGDKKYLGAGGAALMSVIVLALVMAPAAEAASKYKVLHAFYGSDGYQPYAGLIFDAAGNLYGTTLEGGTGCQIGCGTVFKLSPNADGSWTESVLHSFNGSDGAYPYAGLIFDAAGSLYGTAYEGGSGTGCS